MYLTRILSGAGSSIAVAAVALFLGCRAGGPSTTRAEDSTAKSSSASLVQDVSGQAEGPDRCVLLTDEEVRDAIGPHGAGVNDVTNEWGLQSCRWIANSAQKDPASAAWIEVAMFKKETESWAREQAEGQPAKGFVEGARYDSSYGALWFNCAHGRFCVVRARIASGEPKREQHARRLAELVEKRLR